MKLFVPFSLAAFVISAPLLNAADEVDAFAKYDSNRDGSVTYAELARAKKVEFDRLDRNRDKSVSEAEFGAKEEEAASFFSTPTFAAMDADKNGAIALSEFGAAVKMLITAVDSSKDTAVSKEEYTAAVTKQQAEAAAKLQATEKKGSAAKKRLSAKDDHASEAGKHVNFLIC